eukprot:GFUD01019783.1.p1 GENE.GFUD01019783.1~~GFUD01019783.1.p1  ORF type:complete len:197 (+),score=41.36 GFUD01019783.1:60-650(+)
MKSKFTVLTVVILFTSTKPAPQRCETGTVFTVQEGCVDYFDNVICPFGQRIYNTQEDLGECDCLENFGRVAGACYQNKTRGPCEAEQYFVMDTNIDGNSSCQDNPCGSSSKYLPREDERFACLVDPADCAPHVCLEVETGQTGDDLACEVETVDDKIHCREEKVIAVAPGGRPRNCGVRKIWSRYHNRCVRKYRGN